MKRMITDSNQEKTKNLFANLEVNQKSLELRELIMVEIRDKIEIERGIEIEKEKGTEKKIGMRKGTRDLDLEKEKMIKDAIIEIENE